MSNDTELLAVLEKAEFQRSARRNFIRLCGGAAVATGGLSLLAACDDDDNNGNTGVTPTPTATATAGISDVDVLNFALQLEYLEANYYTYAVTGAGIATGIQAGVGTQGAVIPGTGVGAARMVDFTSDPIVGQYAREIAADEIAHVNTLRTALGTAAAAQPAINLSGSASVTANGATVPGAFTAAARAAGVIGATETFDPFASPTNFLIGSYLLTDVGVTAYRGSARLITNKTYLEAAAGLLAVEAYHDGVIRSELYRLGLTTADIFTRIQRISDARDGLDGTSGTAADNDQGIGTAAVANFVPTDANSLALGRTATQVLNVVYLNAAAGTSSGGFFPAGVNGTIRTTVTNPS